MRKAIAIFAIAALTACGGASTESKADTAKATVDTANATTDSTVAPIGAKKDTVEVVK
jgi:hypothetical protein